MNILVVTIKQKLNLLKDNCNATFIVLFIIVGIYPLFVIPNSYDYFYFPRYIILLIMASISIPLLFRNKSKLIHPVFISLAFFLLFAIISTLLAKDSTTAWIGLFGNRTIHIANQPTKVISVLSYRLTGFLTYIFCIILFLLAYQYGKKEKLINSMIICAALVGGIGVLQYFGINIVPHEWFREGYNSYSTFGNPNFMATYFVLILPASIIRYIKTMKIKLVICSGFIYAGLLVSTTRGGYIAFLITFCIIMVYCFKNRKYLKAFNKVIIALLLITIILSPIRDWLIIRRALSIPNNIVSGMKFQDTSGSGRLYIWKQVINILPRYWAFGVGADNLANQGIEFKNSVLDKAHNIYLDMAISFGVFALIAFLIFISNFIKKWRGIDGFMFFTMILSYLLQGVFNIDVIMVMPIFWIVLGLSLSNIEKEKVENGKLEMDNRETFAKGVFS